MRGPRAGRRRSRSSSPRLGPAATLPMLEKLSTEQPAQVRRDLIEAVGLLRDKRGGRRWKDVLSDAAEEVDDAHDGGGVARIGTDEAATHLVATLDGLTGSAASGDRARYHRRRHGRATEAPRHGDARGGAHGDDAMVRAAARASAAPANAWAWKTLADRSEEQKIRETAAAGVVDAFVAHDGEAGTPGGLERAHGRRRAEHAGLIAKRARRARHPGRARRARRPLCDQSDALDPAFSSVVR